MSEGKGKDDAGEIFVGLIVLAVIAYVLFKSWSAVSFYYNPSIYAAMMRDDDGILNRAIAMTMSRSAEIIILYVVGVGVLWLSGRGGDNGLGRAMVFLLPMAAIGFFANRAYQNTMAEYASCRNGGGSFCSRTDAWDMMLVAGMGAFAALGIVAVLYAFVTDS